MNCSYRKKLNSGRFKKSRGLAEIPLLIGLLLMAIAVPVATRLVQNNQDNRNLAAGCSLGSVSCVGGSKYECDDTGKLVKIGTCATATSAPTSGSSGGSKPTAVPTRYCVCDGGFWEGTSCGSVLDKACTSTATPTVSAGGLCTSLSCGTKVKVSIPNSEGYCQCLVPTATLIPTATPTASAGGLCTSLNCGSKVAVKIPNSEGYCQCLVPTATLIPTATPTASANGLCSLISCGTKVKVSIPNSEGYCQCLVPTATPTASACKANGTEVTVASQCCSGNVIKPTASSITVCWGGSTVAATANPTATPTSAAVSSCSSIGSSSECNSSPIGCAWNNTIKECIRADITVVTPTVAGGNTSGGVSGGACPTGTVKLNECFGIQDGSCGGFGCTAGQKKTVKCCYTGQCVTDAEANVCAKGTWTTVTGCADDASCNTSKCTQCPNDAAAKSKGNADCTGGTTINDASIWRAEFISGGLGTTTKTTWSADFDCDGKVTLNDISIWRANFIKGL